MFTEDSAHTRSTFISAVSLGVSQSSARVNVYAIFLDNEGLELMSLIKAEFRGSTVGRGRLTFDYLPILQITFLV